MIGQDIFLLHFYFFIVFRTKKPPQLKDKLSAAVKNTLLVRRRVVTLCTLSNFGYLGVNHSCFQAKFLAPIKLSHRARYSEQ